MSKYKCYGYVNTKSNCRFECNTYQEKVKHDNQFLICCVHWISDIKENSDNVCRWCGVGIK